MRDRVLWTMAMLLGVALTAPALAQSSASSPASTDPAPSADHAPVGTGVPTWIQEKTTDSATQLKELEASLSLSKDKSDKLKADIEAMKGDREKQNAALIAAAARVKAAETEIAAVQTKIGDLIVQELDTRGRLDGADASISNVLAALERISKDPPPAIIVDPSDALGSARSALLISAILPQLKARADQVTADLKHLTEIKTAAQAEEANLKANFDVLEEEQLRIATLIQAQKQNEQTATATLAEEQKQAAEMADKAAQLKQLIADLGRQAQAVAVAADATATANAGGKTPKLDNDTVKLALANTARQQPAVPFAAARGFLDFPVTRGVNVVNFGDGDGFGGVSDGVSVVTNAEAPVRAPADGWVLYTGNYLNYGQIVILDAGQDYTILLAGMARVDVKPGQFVLMGNPVGVMGSRTIGRTVATSAGAQRPTLYIEMRNKNVPIDPTGWWASSDNPTQSG
ncbi:MULTISPECIES: peptidoglycan DD-metalloendopeptidase family protein [unclassified Devosia]|uniref:murein hydrolase activator EnvC family protein n=1 Tax=unclassified Devosia TaxID=196773 RepID=UPI001AD04330|nr:MULTISPECIES: peptidoglycan DD-metalloendopeptidase family protein [unclassified Devosia]MBN9307194.1 peptidoglycan DD-metalloendopeptidase family protein [Devosia sp.]